MEDLTGPEKFELEQMIIRQGAGETDACRNDAPSVGSGASNQDGVHEFATGVVILESLEWRILAIPGDLIGLVRSSETDG